MVLTEFKDLFVEERAQSEWSSVYMILVLAIAALILISIIKPMFQQSQEVKKTTQQALKTPKN